MPSIGGIARARELYCEILGIRYGITFGNDYSVNLVNGIRLGMNELELEILELNIF